MIVDLIILEIYISQIGVQVKKGHSGISLENFPLALLVSFIVNQI
jgi:hypothetical protein